MFFFLFLISFSNPHITHPVTKESYLVPEKQKQKNVSSFGKNQAKRTELLVTLKPWMSSMGWQEHPGPQIICHSSAPRHRSARCLSRLHGRRKSLKTTQPYSPVNQATRKLPFYPVYPNIAKQPSYTALDCYTCKRHLAWEISVYRRRTEGEATFVFKLFLSQDGNSSMNQKNIV